MLQVERVTDVDGIATCDRFPWVLYVDCTGNVLDLTSRFDQRIIARLLFLF